MGIQKSNLDNEKIKQILRQKYDIILKEIIKINKGTANIFKIVGNEGIYILKEFNEKRTVESIKKEINIINFLKDRNVNVPKYIKTKNNNFYIENEGRIVILQEFVDGYTLENNTIEDYERIIESATLLGKVTKELRDDNIYRNKFEQDLDYKIKISEEIESEFDFSIIRKTTIINAHGDYSIQQLIYNDKKETTIIDFEAAKKLPIVWEVIRSYSYIDKDASNGELNIKTLVEYFKEFSKFIKLNEYDLKYAPHIYLMQLIGSTFGYKEYNNDYTQTGLLNFAFFRTKLCRFLYENLEKIGSELSKNIEHK